MSVPEQFVRYENALSSGHEFRFAGALATRGIQNAPPAYPYGWFAVAFSRELRPGSVTTRPFMDREIVLFRTASGDVQAIEAYCPHLGAHLGRGGTVEGEELRCPFHGFRFSVAGKCTHSPYGKPPPAARLGILPLREICGVLLVWHGPPGREPWEIGQPPADGWRPPRTKRMRFHSHPQEVTENSVDIGHFGVLHRFTDIRVVEPMTTDGPYLRACYAIKKPVPLLGGLRGEFRIRADGLGFSLVELALDGGWAIRQLVLTTPTGRRGVDAHIATLLRRRGGSVIARIVRAPIEAVLERIVLTVVAAELRRDQRIWDHKKYLRRPAIAAGDGPIAEYRTWARQFYPQEEQ
ncbi:Rieske 2Fe-2S domain-containing protein [Nocardia carnea]|uniref:Rieske 2Fe-2S domain-containing protein n=1 Tax=Nocardia carnea TaxID=37328 RepID=UPI0024569606|nr:Rieske 2Fe-2S domain-containing protein [Nocardia carnea]